MPFVKRDADGRIIAVFGEQTEPDLEETSPNDPDLTAFLYGHEQEVDTLRSFAESDLAMARVLEDLIDLLMQRGLVKFTDFPEPAQQKLMNRRSLRRHVSYVESMYDDENVERTADLMERTQKGGQGDGE